MGAIETMLGGVVSAEMISVVAGVIEHHGGVSGLVSQFEKQGLGGIVQSWLSSSSNQPITPERIRQALGDNTVTELAAKFGLNPRDLAQKLAQILPRAVDKLTPGGAAPKA